MADKICPRCGKPVVGRSPRAVYCSDACQKQNKLEHDRRRREARVIGVCIACGGKAYGQRHRCPECMRIEAVKQRERRLAKEVQVRRGPLEAYTLEDVREWT